MRRTHGSTENLGAEATHKGKEVRPHAAEPAGGRRRRAEANKDPRGGTNKDVIMRNISEQEVDIQAYCHRRDRREDGKERETLGQPGRKRAFFRPNKIQMDFKNVISFHKISIVHDAFFPAISERYLSYKYVRCRFRLFIPAFVKSLATPTKKAWYPGGIIHTLVKLPGKDPLCWFVHLHGANL